MSIVSLEDFTPSPRFDGVTWVSARIEESASSLGPWTPLATITLTPVDTDPTEPQPRSFTVNGTLDQGWYRVVFLDSQSNFQQPTEPIQNVPDLATDLKPTVAEIGALMRARTKDSNGVEQGTFTSDTRPTEQEVIKIIDSATDDVIATTDTDIPPEAQRNVKNLIRYRTVMLIESGYWPEQVGSNRSFYSQYELLYEKLLPRVEQAVIRETIESEEGEQAEEDIPQPTTPITTNWDSVQW